MEEESVDFSQRRTIVQEAQTRFLYPFLFKPNQIEQAASILASLVHKGHQVWDCTAPPDLYREDLLSNVSGYLFPKEGAGCCFLKVPDRFLSSWFRNGIPMQTSKGTVLAPAVTCSDIELFLSPYGAGILSLTLVPFPAKPEGQSFDQDDVKEANYRGSQLRSRNKPIFTIPVPKVKTELPAPPSPDTDISERLGITGSVFHLGELRDFLIRSLQKLDDWYEPQQNQFSIYTVVRLGKEADFEMDDLRHELGPFLSGLAQVEEARHAGAPRGQIRVANCVLNAKHWVAVSSLGAAHLIADQGTWEASGPSLPFDAQRLQIVRDRYFIPFLLAYLQRLTTLRLIKDAQRAVSSLGQEHSAAHADTRLGELRLEMLRFMVCSNFPEISNREALNSFYDLARQGLRVSESLGIAKGAIAELDATDEAKRGNRNIEIVAAVQTKVEWLEIFFVSFYAADLSHLIGESASFDHTFMSWSVPGWAILAGIVAFRCLRPWEHSQRKRKFLSLRTLLWTALAILAVFWAGFGLHRRESHPVPDPPASTEQLPSEHPGAERRQP